MRYHEFRECFEAAEALPHDVALKEFEELREQGRKAVMGVAGRTARRGVWYEIGVKILDTDIIAPYFYCYDEDGADALRGVGVWREVIKS